MPTGEQTANTWLFMRSAPAKLHWEAAIRSLRLRVNLALWLEHAAPLFFAVGSLAGFSLYAMRRASPETGWIWWATAVTAGALAAAGLAIWRARRGFFTLVDARTWLEHRLGLDSALSAATAGVAPWPSPQTLPKTLRWKIGPACGWLAGALVLALAGALLPLPQRVQSDYERADAKAPALAETEAWLEALAQREIARPEDVENFAEQARGLGERTPEERYSHSALEAADTLRAQTAQAIRSLGANLENAAAALSPLERPAGELGEEELGAVAARLGEALRGLQEGPLAAREDLLEKLGAAANAAGLRSLSPEQARQLRQQLAQAGRAATGVVGAEGQGASVATADPDARLRVGACPGGGACVGTRPDGQPCEAGCVASGGVSRGPGHAPLAFRDEASDAGRGVTETVSADDLSRAALGELLGVERGEHELDAKQSDGPMAAGAITSAGQGGDVVWVDRLTPQERAALKEFFK